MLAVVAYGGGDSLDSGRRIYVRVGCAGAVLRVAHSRL